MSLRWLWLVTYDACVLTLEHLFVNVSAMVRNSLNVHCSALSALVVALAFSYECTSREAVTTSHTAQVWCSTISRWRAIETDWFLDCFASCMWRISWVWWCWRDNRSGLQQAKQISCYIPLRFVPVLAVSDQVTCVFEKLERRIGCPPPKKKNIWYHV